MIVSIKMSKKTRRYYYIASSLYTSTYIFIHSHLLFHYHTILLILLEYLTLQAIKAAPPIIARGTAIHCLPICQLLRPRLSSAGLLLPELQRRQHRGSLLKQIFVILIICRIMLAHRSPRLSPPRRSFRRHSWCRCSTARLRRNSRW